MVINKRLVLRGDIMNIDKETVMVTKTKFQDIKEGLNRNYYKYNNEGCNTNDVKLKALKDAVDELLTLLDKAVS